MLLILAGLLCPDMPAGPVLDTPMLLALEAPAPIELKALDVRYEGPHARLEYVLANPTKSLISLRFFLENAAERCEGECCEPTPVKAPDLRVEGKPLTATGRSVARGMRRFGYALSVPAGRTVRLVHSDAQAFTYDHAVLAGVGLSVLQTAQPWRWGPIGSFTWMIRRSTRPWGVEWPFEQLKLVEYMERPQGKQGGMTTLRLTGKAVVPTDDSLRIKFDIEPWGGGDDCVAMLLHNERALDSQGSMDDPLSDAAHARMVQGMTNAQLETCRNTPYALHGYAFKRKDLRAAFYGDAEPGRLRFAPNPHFKPSLLSARAVALIRRIKLEEARRRSGGEAPR